MMNKFLCIGLLCSLTSPLFADDTASGIFSQQQAQRGGEQYRARCVSCHGNDLRGNSNSPSLLGLSFLFLWEGRSVGELYSKMRNEMPTDNPGSLQPQNYSDILAFILAENGYPAGTVDLGSDVAALAGISIVAPPSE